MLTGDAAYIKKMNRSLILSKIMEHKVISRADLAKLTGLNKATISVQVADLLAEQLIIESQQDHHNLGRKPIMLSINHQAGFALGIDLDRNLISFTLSDLKGCPVQQDSIEIDTADYQSIIRILSERILHHQKNCAQSNYGLIGVVIGIHGIVDNAESIYFAPHHQWQHKNLKEDLMNETGMTIYIENNANLCSYAEKVYKYQQCDNLLSLTLYSGIGLGIMIKGEMLKGYHGYAGEIGHMIVVPDGKPCSCGNLGCWEQYASERSFYKQIREDYGKITPDDIQHMIISQEPNTLTYLEQYIKLLSIGINNIINLYNPEVLVINSELLRMYPYAIEEIKSRISSTVGHYRELKISEYGKAACIMGACALAIKYFFQVSELRLSLEEKEITI
jgi:predicted NBD/HSP70 family sugar kinase